MRVGKDRPANGRQPRVSAGALRRPIRRKPQSEGVENSGRELSLRRLLHDQIRLSRPWATNKKPQRGVYIAAAQFGLAERVAQGESHSAQRIPAE
jgi:hypothetical protein